MEDTVSVIGLDKALELLAETAEIQKNGGMTTQDGKYVTEKHICIVQCKMIRHV